MTEQTQNDDFRGLIERIKQAFSAVPYPGDDDIISTPDHVAICEECSGLRAVLAGKRWEEVLDDERWLNHLGHAMSFFSASGWHYFLPAYLIQNLKQQAFRSSYFRPHSKPRLIVYQERRRERLSAEQCSVVVEYLSVVLHNDHTSRYCTEANKVALKHWQQNYQKIKGEKSMSSASAPATEQQSYPYFTEEHAMLRETVKQFCLKEIAPFAEEWDEEGIFPRELFKKAGDLGLFGIRINPKWGGSGLDWWATAAYFEGLSYANNGGVGMALMVQSDITLPALEELGTDEQKEEFLIPAVAGDFIAALGISEPGGGSDVANLKTRARIDGDDFVISGQKLWITNGTRADFIILAVRTGEEGHKGISMVLFPTKTQGFSVGKKLKKIGNLSSDTAELFFDNCRIPRRYLLGELNRGFYYTMINFQGERLAAALGALYKMERALEYAINYGKERQAFGQPIASFQVWRHRFAEHMTSIEAAKWLCYRALDLMNRGQKCVREITMAKLFCSELDQRVMYDCMQIMGGFAYTTEYPIGRAWRDARLNTIGAGASEIMKEIIAKDAKL